MKQAASLVLLGVMLGSFSAVHAEGSRKEIPDSIGKAVVLDSLEVDLGDRSIFYNRIEPPVLKPWVRPKAAPAEPAQTYVPTAEELAEEKRLAALPYEWLNVEAAVYVGRGSEVRMSTKEGDVVALSSVDFRYFDIIFDFKDEGVSYSTFCMQYSWTQEELAEWRREDPTATWPVVP